MLAHDLADLMGDKVDTILNHYCHNGQKAKSLPPFCHKQTTVEKIATETPSILITSEEIVKSTVKSLSFQQNLWLRIY